MKTKEPKPLTREDFIKWGRLGGQTKQLNKKKSKKNKLRKYKKPTENYEVVQETLDNVISRG